MSQVEQFARDNAQKVTVVGIAPESWQSRSEARGFVSRNRVTFLNLWDETNAVHRNYGKPYTSRFLLIRKDGSRVGSPASFSVSRAQEILDGLE